MSRALPGEEEGPCIRNREKILDIYYIYKYKTYIYINIYI